MLCCSLLLCEFPFFFHSFFHSSSIPRAAIFFKFVTFKTRVILCYTLRKEGRAFRNIGKYIPILCNQPCLFSCIFFSRGFLRVTHDGLSETGTFRGLRKNSRFWKTFICHESNAAHTFQTKTFILVWYK